MKKRGQTLGALPQRLSLKRGTVVAFALFSLWALGISVPLGLFSASHMAVLPVAEGAVSTGGSGSAGEWSMVHVISEECPCSRGVARYLLARGALEGVEEEIVLLGGSDETSRALRAAGFAVSTADAEEFCAQFGSEGVPFFQVIDDGDEAAYSGSYFDSAFRGNEGFLDLETFRRLRSGGFVIGRPVYGCATSERLKSVLDPFGFK